jgi:hypothetical protein
MNLICLASDLLSTLKRTGPSLKKLEGVDIRSEEITAMISRKNYWNYLDKKVHIKG